MMYLMEDDLVNLRYVKNVKLSEPSTPDQTWSVMILMEHGWEHPIKGDRQYCEEEFAKIIDSTHGKQL